MILTLKKGLVLLFGSSMLTCCGKKEENYNQHAEASIILKKSNKTKTSNYGDFIENRNAAQPVNDANAQEEKRRETAKFAREHVSKNGLRSIRDMYYMLSGVERNDAMTTVIGILSKNIPRETLLNEIGILPPGIMKSAWISQALNSHGTPYEISQGLAGAINALGYEEDKRAAVNAVCINSKLSNKNEFGSVIDLIESLGPVLNDDVKNAYVSKVSSRYASLMASNDSWLEPANTFPDEIPSKEKEEAVGIVAKEIAKKNIDDLHLFYEKINSTASEYAHAVYVSSFEMIGKNNPNDGINYISRLNGTELNYAVEGLMTGWVSYDPMAASQWAAQLSDPIAKSKASEIIVRYLTENRSSIEEINAWRANIIN